MESGEPRNTSRSPQCSGLPSGSSGNRGPRDNDGSSRLLTSKSSAAYSRLPSSDTANWPALGPSCGPTATSSVTGSTETKVPPQLGWLELTVASSLPCPGHQIRSLTASDNER